MSTKSQNLLFFTTNSWPKTKNSRIYLKTQAKKLNFRLFQNRWISAKCTKIKPALVVKRANSIELFLWPHLTCYNLRCHPRVRVVRQDSEPDQVHLAVCHLTAPVLPGPETSQDAPCAGQNAERDCPGPNQVNRFPVLSQLNVKP